MKRVLFQFSRFHLQPLSGFHLQPFSTTTIPTSQLPKLLEPFLSGGANSAFNRRPQSSSNKQSDFVRHQKFKDEIQRFCMEGKEDSARSTLAQYISRSEKSHFIDSQTILRISNMFCKLGNTARCEEMLDFYRKLGRHKNQKKNYKNLRLIKMEENVLLSFLYRELDQSSLKGHIREKLSVIKDSSDGSSLGIMSKVLQKHNMYPELSDLVEMLMERDTVYPEPLFALAEHKLNNKDTQGAEKLLVESSSKMVHGWFTADDYSRMAKLLSQIYTDKVDYLLLGKLAGVPKSSVLKFNHFQSPVRRLEVIAGNYEVALHLASTADSVTGLFKVIGGRWGLVRTVLEHEPDRAEFLEVVQYLGKVMKHYQLQMDKPFWKHLMFNFFRIREQDLPYEEFCNFYQACPAYPLTPDLWSRVVRRVNKNELEFVLNDAIRQGTMDKMVYGEFLRRGPYNADSTILLTLEDLAEEFAGEDV